MTGVQTCALPIYKFNKLNSQWDNIKKNAWDTRTNQPYKNILKGEKYDKFINKKKIEKEELIVHCVTDADKQGFKEAVEKLEDSKEKHNNELKIIYSSSEELKHKKQFEYNHRDKYKMKYNPKNFDELKKDQYDYYKKEQEKIEKDKNNVMDILDNLLNNGMLDEKEIEKIEKEEKTFNSGLNSVNTNKYAEQKNNSLIKSNDKNIVKEQKEIKPESIRNDLTSKSSHKEATIEKNKVTEKNQTNISKDMDDLKKKYMDKQKRK